MSQHLMTIQQISQLHLLYCKEKKLGKMASGKITLRFTE